MAIVLVTLIALAALLVAPRIAGRLPGRAGRIANILVEELKVLLQAIVASGIVLSGIYILVSGFIGSRESRLSAVVWFEETFDWLETSLGLFQISAWTSAVIFAVLLGIALSRIIERTGKLLGREWSSGFLGPLGRMFGRYRRLTTRTQVAAVVLANVTFLGAQGGEIRDIAAAQIERAERGLAEVAEAEAEARATLMARHFVKEAWQEQPARFRILFKTSTLREEIAEREAKLLADFSSHRRRFTQLETRLRASADEAKAFVKEARQSRGDAPKAANAGEHLAIRQGTAELSLADIDRAKAEVDQLTRDGAGDGEVATELTRATVEATVQALIDPTRIDVLRALGEEVPLLRPVIDALAGVVQSAAAEATSTFNSASRNVLQEGGAALRNWITEQATRWRDRLPAVSRSTEPIGTEVAETLAELQSLKRELDRASRDRRAALMDEGAAAIESLHADLRQRFASVWDVELWRLRSRLARQESFPSPRDVLDRLSTEYVIERRLLREMVERNVFLDGTPLTGEGTRSSEAGTVRVGTALEEMLNRIGAISEPADRLRAVREIEAAASTSSAEAALIAITETAARHAVVAGTSVARLVAVLRRPATSGPSVGLGSSSSYRPQPYRPPRRPVARR